MRPAPTLSLHSAFLLPPSLSALPSPGLESLSLQAFKSQSGKQCWHPGSERPPVAVLFYRDHSLSKESDERRSLQDQLDLGGSGVQSSHTEVVLDPLLVSSPSFGRESRRNLGEEWVGSSNLPQMRQVTTSPALFPFYEEPCATHFKCSRGDNKMIGENSRKISSMYTAFLQNLSIFSCIPG